MLTNNKIAIYNIRFSILKSIIFVVFFINSSCRKLVEVNAPVTELASNVIFENNSSAAAVLTGIYDRMATDGRNNFASGLNSISLLGGLSADELTNYSTDPLLSSFYTNALLSKSVPFWYELYNYIYTANASIEGITASNGETAPVKQQLIGEAKFIRAFCHFYLANLFGDVPLITTSDYRINSITGRTSKNQIYQQIISDLKDAENLLSATYVKADAITITSERVRPTKWAAKALLARVYLYTSDWTDAEAEATAVINNSSMFSLNSNLNDVFLSNSSEAIWQLQPVQPGFNTYDAYYFILSSEPDNSNPVALSTNLLNSFDSADNRKIKWIGSVTSGGLTYYYSNKYKIGAYGLPVTEYIMVMRLAEQYLIRAEARAQQNNIIGAQSDLNMIRQRAGLLNSSANDKTSLLAAILHEKQTEFFTEWGHRWFDLKRTGTVNAVMGYVSIQKGGTWSPNAALYPIPFTEIQNDPSLVQNPGYQ